MWSDEIDSYTLTALAHSYMRRQRFEAQVMAAVSPMMQLQRKETPVSQNVSLDNMFGLMGVDVPGG